MKTYGNNGAGSQSMNHHTRITSLEDSSTLKTWSKKLTTKNDSSFSGLMSTSTITGIKSNAANVNNNAEEDGGKYYL